MLSKVVSSYLNERFPEKINQIEPGEERGPFIRISADASDFGDIELFDDGDEVTIVFGRFTHSHYSNYDDISETEKESRIAEDVYDVLQATFADELEFWGSHQGSGGFRGVGYGNQKKLGIFSRIFSRDGSRSYFRWSGTKRKTKS